jgi:hypothetical protein
VSFFSSGTHLERLNDCQCIPPELPGASFTAISTIKKAGKMEKNTLHFLRISGDVPENKRREFEQTFKFVFNQLPSDCIEHSLSADVFINGHYHFFSLWLSGSAMKLFMSSVEFQLLTGAYFTLGDEEKIVHGPIDVQSFQVTNMN